MRICEFCDGPNHRARSSFCSRSCDKKMKKICYIQTGRCIRCGNVNNTKKTICLECLSKQKLFDLNNKSKKTEYYNNRRQEAVKNGFCSVCCVKLTDDGKKVCSYCCERSRSNLMDNPNYRKIVILKNAKLRAKKRGVPCTITIDDIVVPETCPILGITLQYGNGKLSGHSPSLDCIVPAQGYIPGNICVISHKANTLKSNMTINILEKIIAYIKKRAKYDI